MRNNLPIRFQFIGRSVGIGVLALLFATSASAQTTVFGSDNDGFGGFTTSATSGTETWSNEAGSIRYAFGELGTDEGFTASLLNSYTLSKNAGAAYTIQGAVDLTAGYGDDNNRIGILLFNDTATQIGDGGGGLYLRVNTDDNNAIEIRNGINGNLLSNTVSHSYDPGDQWIGQTVTFTADLTFKSGDLFDISFVLLDGNANEYTVTAADLDATIYTGTHFGFASRWRQRGSNVSNRNVPAELNYESFSITQTAVPEVSAYAFLLGGAALGLVAVRRRR